MTKETKIVGDKTLIYTFNEDIHPTLDDAITAKEAYLLGLSTLQSAFNLSPTEQNRAALVNWINTQDQGFINVEYFIPGSHAPDIDFKFLTEKQVRDLARRLQPYILNRTV